MNQDHSVIRRNRVIDLLRGVAAALMILGHAFIVYPVNIAEVPWCAAIEHFIYTFHMELFFLLAGVVYSCRNYASFISKKVRRILIPYVFFGVLTMLMRAFGGSAVNGVEPLGEGIYKLVFQGGGYWFLYVLFLIFAVYPWIERVCRGLLKEGAVGLVCLAVDTLFILPNIVQLSGIVKYLPYFICGRIVSRAVLRDRLISGKNRWWIAIAALCLYAGLDYLETAFGELIAALHFIRAVAIITVLYVLLCSFAADPHPGKGKRLLCSFLTDSSRYSLQLYLFNGYLLTASRIVMCSLLHITNPLILVPGIWIVNMAGTLIACKWILPRIPVVKQLCGLE